MHEYKTNDITLYKFNILEPCHEIKHFITGRNGGFSDGKYKGLNIGFGTDDNPDIVLKNRHALTKILGIPLDWFVFPDQTHSANVAIVNISHRGSGCFSRENSISNTDSLITNDKNICIVVQVADCVPLLLFDSYNIVIASIHAGWRSTFGEIVINTIKTMKREFKTNPSDIIACIGPSIGSCCYETGNDIKQKFIKKKALYADSFISKDDKHYLDLWKANKIQLFQAGVKEENIETAGICTRCNNDMFYSSRAGKGITGRFLAGIMLQ